MAGLKPTEILILVLLVVLLFGAKKLPDAARGLGRSLRIFKAETKGLMDEDKTEDGEAAPTPAIEQSSAPSTPVAGTPTTATDAPVVQPAAAQPASSQPAAEHPAKPGSPSA